MDTVQALFVGGFKDGVHMDTVFKPTIKFALPIKMLCASKISEGMDVPENIARIVEYKLAALSVDKQHVIYTLSGTLKELFDREFYRESFLKNQN